jgi:23S rRNA pseudouridine1911/1915/1917 synthase
MPIHIIHEDNHLLVVNKAAGILVQGDATGDTPLVELGKAYIKERYGKPGNVFLGVPHRIDRPVSGLVVFARTSKALSRLTEAFRTRSVRKEYWALTARRPPADAGTLRHWLVKDESSNSVRAFPKQRDGAKEAVLDYKLQRVFDHFHLLEVFPVTGRPHQIRVQLMAMGCPIRGDLKYNYPEPNADRNISLHARSITFEHPVTRDELTLTAPVPRTESWLFPGAPADLYTATS